MKASDTVITKIHPEGHLFVAIFFLISLVLFYLYSPLGWAGFVLTLWCAYFFRDPERVTPEGDGIAVAPADGTVSLVDMKVPPVELNMGDEERQRVCIFMNVFNVHVNRTPVSGHVGKLVYVPGLFLNAADESAGDKNERQMMRLDQENGDQLGVVQVAGLVARRILCHAKEGEHFDAGQRYGLIRFGSRVDIYLPSSLTATVTPGQTMIAGETVIANSRGE